jgi:hypothetical protein
MLLAERPVQKFDMNPFALPIAPPVHENDDHFFSEWTGGVVQ